MYSSQTTSHTHTTTEIKKRSSSSPLSSLCSSSSSQKTVLMTTKKKKKNTTTARLSTEPQSVAARERRHRISERFKILKSLVPGGSKMDTVSMLDQAIHYVNFLKAQIWLHHQHYSFTNTDIATSSSDTTNTYLHHGYMIDDHYTTVHHLCDAQMVPDHSHAYM